MVEKLASVAPGRLASLLTEGLRGHHLLFEPEAIRDAFDAPEVPLSKEDAATVGEALLTICRAPLPTAQGAVATLTPAGRIALIRLYFRLLERAEEARGATH